MLYANKGNFGFFSLASNLSLQLLMENISGGIALTPGTIELES